MKTIQLEYEQLDAIVTSELKECVASLLEQDDTSLAQSFLAVLEYYLPYSEFNEYKASLGLRNLPKDTIEVVSVDEMPDGSANLTFSASADTLQLLSNEGLKFLLMKAALDITDDDVMSLQKG